MSSYATIADLSQIVPARELIQLSDDAQTGLVNEAQVTRALTQADNIIDAYVGRYYKRVDLAAPHPPLLVDLACHIAHYRLFRGTKATEHVEKHYDDAIKHLKLISEGKAKIDQGEETLPERDGMILIDAPEREFSREKLGQL